MLTDVELADLGPRRLRDIARPVELFQVRAPGLRTDFPPLKTLDATPGNLKPQTTSFVGREMAIAELETAIKANRLVTLTGVGGVGKTRLAVEVAVRLKSAFPDGIWMIELAPVGDPAAVPEATAAVLGITPQAGLSLSDTIATVMEGRSRLLVFDNCEHVLDAAAELIETIIEHSSTVRVLATSREGLGVADEQLWPVPALDVNAGADSEAATLFAERAQHVAPEITLSADTSAGAVVEICRRLDGIPLAIELAASRMLSMTVTELRDRLDDRFRLLVGSRRGLERHQTLRHAVQWSYELLDDNEKAILNRCSVFAGGFDLASACAVTGADDEFTTLDLLDALVRKSLLSADRSAVRTRFSMLETIRQFAEEQLVASGEADELRTAHAHHFAGQEPDVLALWDSRRQQESYDWFTLELANLRAAFRWAADHEDLDRASAIAVCASLLGSFVEQFEPGAWAEEIIGPARGIQHPRLAQLYAMAARCFAASRFDDAIRYGEAALRAVDSGRFDEVPFDLASEFGLIYVIRGEPERWITQCRNMISESAGPHILPRVHLSMTLALTGAHDEAWRPQKSSVTPTASRRILRSSAGRSLRTGTAGSTQIRSARLRRTDWARESRVNPEIDCSRRTTRRTCLGSRLNTVTRRRRSTSSRCRSAITSTPATTFCCPSQWRYWPTILTASNISKLPLRSVVLPRHLSRRIIFPKPRLRSPTCGRLWAKKPMPPSRDAALP